MLKEVQVPYTIGHQTITSKEKLKKIKKRANKILRDWFRKKVTKWEKQLQSLLNNFDARKVSPLTLKRLKNITKKNVIDYKLFVYVKEEFWEGYADHIRARKYRDLAQDMNERMELNRKLKLVEKFNSSFIQRDVEKDSPEFLEALSRIEEEFKREIYYNPEIPRWRNIIKDKLGRKY